MPSAPGVFTTIGGGGADTAPAATWNAVGARSIAMTTGPDRSGTLGETAATGVMTACTDGIGLFAPWVGSGVALTAPAKTSGLITATLNACTRDVGSSRFRTAATAG
ncbi:hypothetical protein MYSI104531_08235 [Mycobacterium simiae]